MCEVREQKRDGKRAPPNETPTNSLTVSLLLQRHEMLSDRHDSKKTSFKKSYAADQALSSWRL
jgi:hypothetical protein